jgi:hypothetical protein
MTDDEIEREIDRRLEAELAAKRAVLRAEIASRLQREADRAHYAGIERRWREREAAEKAAEPQRRADMLKRAQADMEHMDRSNSRVVPGTLAATRAADRAGGRAGFRVKG